MARSQEEKDKSILDYFSGSNPNRKKVQEAIRKRKEKEKKKKKGVKPVSGNLGM